MLQTQLESPANDKTEAALMGVGREGCVGVGVGLDLLEISITAALQASSPSVRNCCPIWDYNILIKIGKV